MKNEMCSNVGNSQVRMCVSTAGGWTPEYLSMGLRPDIRGKQTGRREAGRKGTPETKPPTLDFT